MKCSARAEFFSLSAVNFLSCAVLVCLLGCASTSGINVSTQAPGWVFSSSAAYSDEQYLSASGWDKDRSVAESKAKAELVKTIRQTVEARSTAVVSYAENQGAFSEGRSVETSVNTSAELEIAGLFIKEAWRDKSGVYYALALLDRDESGRYYRTLIQKTRQSLIRKFILRGKIKKALIHIQLQNARWRSPKKTMDTSRCFPRSIPQCIS
jgi:hypothetical protein